MTPKTSIMFLLGLTFLSVTARAELKATIFIQAKPTAKVRLAAHEIRRYFYLRTGILPTIQQGQMSSRVPDISFVLVTRAGGLMNIPDKNSLQTSIRKLGPEGYMLKTVMRKGSQMHVIAGGDENGLLYGSYAFVEQMGVRFYLHGDVVPDDKMDLKNFSVPEEVGRPLFSIRGIQPFHDFPEGPDWWTEDDYKSVLSQLPKLKMNFIGLHTYPEGGVGPEPLVWIGLKEDMAENGSVNRSYRARHFTNMNGTWGFAKRPTSAYWNKMGDLFENDIAGTAYMKGVSEWPVTAQEQNALFNRAAGFFSDVFGYARELGIHTCIGTETPLVVPAKVKSAIAANGVDSAGPLTTQLLYEGMFTWVKRHYPIDYYWFWTPEDWTWRQNTPKELSKTKSDLEAALRAAEKVKVPFTLATCGWVLGPAGDRSAFDQFLPKTWPMSCINRYVGFEPIEADFARTWDRPLWAIPWLEDDPGLTVPQLWAGRMRRDAVDAAANGCSGLIGIHWRTRILGPNVSALASAAWEQPWNSRLGWKASAQEAAERKKIMNLDYPVNDFYRDWAKANFGGDSADAIGMVFSKLDGGPTFVPNTAYLTWLPRPADWVDGPGGVRPDTLSWGEREKDYRFIDILERLRASVAGEGNLERFDYWLDSFKYLRAFGKFACSAGKVKRLIERAEKSSEPELSLRWDRFVSLRKEQIEELQEVSTCLIRVIGTRGELGTVANWQQHVRDISLERPAAIMEKLTGKTLPKDCWPSDTQLDVKKMIVPTVRSDIRKGEGLRLEALFYGVEPKSLEVRWRTLGDSTFQTLQFSRVARNVFATTIPSDRIKEDFEYSISAVASDGRDYHFPATAPMMNQTVVVY